MISRGGTFSVDLWFSLLISSLLLFGHEVSTDAQTTTLSVTDFGCKGDAVRFVSTTVSNSALITVQSTNRLSGSDVGKLVLLFGAGLPTSGTNHQDLVAQIIAVGFGTNVTLSLPAGLSADQVSGMYGTQNAQSFQRCVDACSGTNTTVQIPPGNYLMVPPVMLDPTFVMNGCTDGRPSVTIQKGGIHFIGAGADSTILQGCGAWLLKGSYVERGFMFFCQGPVTNDAPVIFEGLTLDGGVLNGAIANKNFPASVVDGTGWDETHGAVLDIGTPPLHAFKAFRDCRITHWRGEMFKSVAPNTDGFIEISNCVFDDGNASAVNFSFSHKISNSTFSNVKMAMEFYAGYSFEASSFENSIVTNTQGGLVLTGALTNRVMPSYTISGNAVSSSDFSVLMGPSRSVSITSNRFFSATSGIMTSGIAYQGTDYNRDIDIENNTFTNVYQPFINGGVGSDRMENVTVRNNVASGCGTFAYGNGWGTNVVFTGNVVVGGGSGLNSTTLTGQWYIDDGSNQFPPQFLPGVLGLETNLVSYARGMRFQTWVNVTNAVYAIDDAHPQQIPPGASLSIAHQGMYPVPVFLSSTLFRSGPSAILTGGQALTFTWSNGAWHLLQNSLLPPSGLLVLPR
jgi:hypothetical protein